MKGLLLAVDTAGDGVSFALGDGNRVWSLRRKAKAADEALWPALETVLKKAGKKLGDLEGLTCVTGPGRFTAVRIGVTFADALARSLGVPAVGLTRFEAYGPRVRGRAALVVPALREEWFLQFWTPEGPVAPPVWVAKDGLDAALGGAPSVDIRGVGAKDLLAPARTCLGAGSRPPLRPLYLKPANYAK